MIFRRLSCGQRLSSGGGPARARPKCRRVGCERPTRNGLPDGCCSEECRLAQEEADEEEERVRLEEELSRNEQELKELKQNKTTRQAERRRRTKALERRIEECQAQEQAAAKKLASDEQRSESLERKEQDLQDRLNEQDRRYSEESLLWARKEVLLHHRTKCFDSSACVQGGILACNESENEQLAEAKVKLLNETVELQVNRAGLREQLRAMRCAGKPTSCAIQLEPPVVSEIGPPPDRLPRPAISVGVEGPPPAKAPQCKGKGKGGPPPPPKAKAPPARAPGGLPKATPPKKNNLINIHWKTLPPPPAAPTQARPDEFLERTTKLALPFLGTGEGQPSALVWPGMSETIFAKPPENKEVRELPQELLDVYFRGKQSKQLQQLNAAAGGGGPGGAGGGRELLDGKRLQMLGILLRKHLMAHKGETAHDAVMSIKRGVLRCNFEVTRQECLSVFHLIFINHEDEVRKISEFVRQHGEAALPLFELRMVYELGKVPQIGMRLECMLFESAFDENLQKANESLRVFSSALQLLDQKREALRLLFATAHKLGKQLNCDSRATEAPRGFQLAALDKLLQAKSTRSSKHNVLHFAVALMREQDVPFTERDVQILQRAKGLTSDMVYQDCYDLSEGLRAMRDINETMTYKCRATGTKVKIHRRRKTLAGPAAAASRDAAEDGPAADDDTAVVDADDLFHEQARAFVDEKLEQGDRVARACFEAFVLYRELACFLGDFHSVYPPPRSENDQRQDLLAVMLRWAEEVVNAGTVVKKTDLRRLLRPTPSSRTSGIVASMQHIAMQNGSIPSS